MYFMVSRYTRTFCRLLLRDGDATRLHTIWHHVEGHYRAYIAFNPGGKDNGKPRRLAFWVVRQYDKFDFAKPNNPLLTADELRIWQWEKLTEHVSQECGEYYLSLADAIRQKQQIGAGI